MMFKKKVGNISYPDYLDVACGPVGPQGPALKGVEETRSPHAHAQPLNYSVMRIAPALLAWR